MKRLLMIFVALSLLSLLTACIQIEQPVVVQKEAPVAAEAEKVAEEAPAVEAAPAAEEKLRVFYSNQQVGHPFWNVVTQGVNDAAERYGMEVDMAGPTSMDNAAQIQMIEAAIATGEYDAMVIPAIVPSMFQPTIDKAVAAGITVVTFGEDAPESQRTCYVGTSNFNAGQTAGEILAELTGGKANINIISGQAAEPGLNQRIDGFKDALKEYPEMQVSSIDYGEAGIQENVSELQARLVSDPDINAFFSSMAEGGTALATVYPDFKDRLDTTPSVVFDDLPQTLDAIRAGIVDATMVQRQYNWGFGSVYQVHRLLQKGLPCTAEVTDTSVVVVTKDNVDTYAKETMDPQMWLDFEAEEL